MLAKCPLAKCPLVKCPLTKCPLDKYPGFEQYYQASNDRRDDTLIDV